MSAAVRQSWGENKQQQHQGNHGGFQAVAAAGGAPAGPGPVSRLRQTRSLDLDVYNWADVNSICGLPHLARYAGVTRAVFTVILLAFLGLTIHDTYKLLADYFSYPVKTEFSLKFSAVQFPSVTICNVNPVRKSQVYLTSESFKWFLQYIKEDLLDHDNSEADTVTADPNWQHIIADDPDAYFGNTNSPPMKPSTDRRGMGPPQAEQDYYEWDLSYESDTYDPNIGNEVDYVSALYHMFKYVYTQETPQVRRAIGHQPSDTVLYCIYNGRPCSSRNFKWILSPDYGNCFTFNYAKNDTQDSYVVRKAGPQSGLSLMLYVDQAEYMPFTQSAGFRVIIHDFYTMPFPYEAGFSVHPGHDTSVAMTLQVIKRQSLPYNNCTEGTAFFTDTGFKYSTLACQDECMQREIFHRCNCSSPMLNVNLKGKRTCREAEETCVIDVKQNFFSSIDYDKKCPCYSPCNEKAYAHDISSASWPSKAYLPSLMKLVKGMDTPNSNITQKFNSAVEQYEDGSTGQQDSAPPPPDIISSDFAMLNIYFKELNFNNITETPEYNRDKLMADLGGVLGLYIGITAFSLIEIIHMIFISIKWCTGFYRSGSTSTGNRVKNMQQMDHKEHQVQRK